MLPSLGIIRMLEGLKAHPNPMFTKNLSKKMHQSVDFWSAFERLVSLGGTLFQKTLPVMSLKEAAFGFRQQVYNAPF